MLTPDEPKTKFLSALVINLTTMVRLDGDEGGHARPMTGQFDDERSPIWFFAMTVTANGFGLSANVRGKIPLDTDLDVTDRLWHSYNAAWYAGNGDPKLALLRLDDEEAKIRRVESGLYACVKAIPGCDPKWDNAENVATIALD